MTEGNAAIGKTGSLIIYTRCGKRLSRKTARIIDGKPLCSACLFPELKGGRNIG